MVDCDGGDGVAFVEDSFLVEHEFLVGINCYGNWPLPNDIEQTGAVVKFMTGI